MSESQERSSSDWIKTYRPFFFESLSGITCVGVNKILLCDRSRGMLTEVDLITETETFKKRYDVNDYAEVNSICYYEGELYSVYQNCIYIAEYNGQEDVLNPELWICLPDRGDLTGIAVTAEKVYLVTKNQSILCCDRQTKEVNQIGEVPGIGTVDDLCYFQGNLLIVDSKEQTVYVFELENRKFLYEILTPFENPTGIAVVYHEKAGRDVLYVSYSRPSFEVYDTGDSEFKLKIDTPVPDNFIYPLVYRCDRDKKAVLSNGFLLEMYYVRKLHALPEVAKKYKKVKNIEWKISLPIDSDRQKLLSFEPIGDFSMRVEEIAEEDNRKMAVFSIPKLKLKKERRVFGWKALIEVHGIKYFLQEEEVRPISEEELQRYAKYLENEPNLDMDRPFVIEAAKEAVKHLKEEQKNNILAKAKAIRDYIYEKITYVMDAYNEGTEDVLKSGRGSCGEYLNVFLSLLRLNNIPARRCGNYKVPAYKMQAGARSLFLSPDFNHVWLQFYVPDLGWVPLESSADDEASSFREWAKRYFMALAWYHAECRIGSYFEDVFEAGKEQPFFLSPDDISIKDIKFKVIGELDLKF
jgi:hypothetical protein